MNPYAQAAIAASISFVIVFITSIISLFVSPVWGAVFWSLPFSTVSIIIASYLGQQDDSFSYNLLFSASSTMLALVTLMLVFGVGIKNWFPESRVQKYWGSFGIGLAAWFLVNGAFIGIVYGVPSVYKALF